jgi:endonuclease/exonuclease/phosphatase family metal-dependent hydrolase
MRLVSWNVQHGVPTPLGPADLARALPQVSGLDADIVALQELDQGRTRSGGVDQPAMVADALRAVAVFAPALHRGGGYGVGLFVRGEVVRSWLDRLAGPGEARVLLVAEVELADGPWTVATTHLSTTRAVARAQLAQVASLLAGRPGPLVLAGDCNLGAPSVRALLPGLDLVPGGPTHSARRGRPDRRIDHVAVRGATVAGERVVRLPVSDHLAVVVDLRADATAGPEGPAADSDGTGGTT